MYQLAIVWWLLSQAGKSGGLALGAFLVVCALPSILLVKPIGRTVDKIRSKRLLVTCDLGAFVLMMWAGGLLESGSFSLIQTYVVGFTIALIEGFFNPGLNKALPEIVLAEDMESAVSFQSSTQSMASFVGALAGAFLIDRVGIPGLVIINGYSFLFSALVNWLIRFKAPELMKGAPAGVAAGSYATLDLDRMPLLKKILLGFGMINFFATPILVVLPLFVQKTLKEPASTLGKLEAALCLGLLVGTFSSSFIESEHRTVKVGAVCLTILGLSIFLPGLFPFFSTTLLFLFVAGCALGINNVKFVTLFQAIVPTAVKGKFFAIMQALISFTFPVAYLLFGFLGDLVEASVLFLIEGAGVMIVSGFFWFLSRRESELYEPVTEGGEGR